ncbi:Low-density lipoprotein receptor [Thelohanellus kitauei]|uniref:Low-density lipoprotein receptor n=1 Tax=Thelohanellus kitauei TaxID=669202 RepID=A0A0C2MF27_THEKT|nr:Low-density lipoprotein receptor [Thelohanellus kitauei]
MFGAKPICDGKSDCPDGSDETDCARITLRCINDSFECMNDRCIPNQRVCDGNNDCGDWSDEENCLEKMCADYGAYCDCGGCIHRHQICDDIFHCIDFSDERACISAHSFR